MAAAAAAASQFQREISAQAAIAGDAAARDGQVASGGQQLECARRTYFAQRADLLLRATSERCDGRLAGWLTRANNKFTGACLAIFQSLAGHSRLGRSEASAFRPRVHPGGGGGGVFAFAEVKEEPAEFR